jgi:Iap family predicted aminopeptidase
LIPTVDRVKKENLKNTIEKLSSYGNRWIGRVGERLTSSYIMDIFNELGMDEVLTQEFQVIDYVPINCSLLLTSPIKEEVVCEPLQFTECSQVEGEMVFLGEFENHSESLNLPTDNIKDKIVLMVSDTPAFYINELVKKKAVGLIVATDAPNGLIRSLAGKTYPPPLNDYIDTWKTPIPGVIISKKSLYRLLSLLSLGKVKVSIEHKADYRTVTTRNVIGVLSGLNKNNNQEIILGAHYDSQMKGLGVWDNLTGISVLIELARIFCLNKNNKRNIVFSAFGAEEVGLWGSTLYVENRKREIKENCIAMFCLDAVSNVFSNKKSLWSEGKLKDFIIERSIRYGFRIDNIHPLDLSYSDYYPFAVNEVPSAMLWENPPTHPYYHTEEDTIEYINFDKLASISNFILALINEIAYNHTLNFSKNKES